MKLKEILINLVEMVIGTLVMAMGVELFLVPNQLSTGGFSGLSTIIYYITGISVGNVMLILNVPLFILALIKLGKRFFAKSLIGTALLSLFLNIFQSFEPITDDRFLAFIYGSVIVGIGTALILRANGSTRRIRPIGKYNKNI